MCTGTCNHSICELCFDNQQSGICSVCKKENSFVVKNINYHAMDMLEELKATITFSTMAKACSSSETIYMGSCSGCSEFNKKLRICVVCSKEAGLLIEPDDGVFKIPTAATFGELLEHKLLKIKSSAICADCIMDKGSHQGHKTISIEKVNNLASASGKVDILSVVALSLHKIKNRTEGLSQGKLPITICEIASQIQELGVVSGDLVAKEFDETDSLDHGYLLMLKLSLRYMNTMNSKNRDMLDSLLQRGSEKLTKTDNPEERIEFQKVLDRIQEIRDQMNSRIGATSPTAQPMDVVQDVADLLKSGMVQDLFGQWKSEIYSDDAKEFAQDMLNISKDVRRTIPFKVPEKYVKYADLAENCLKFFLD